MKRAFSILFAVNFLSLFAYAEQPRASKAQAAFLASSCASSEAAVLQEQGYQPQETSVALIVADWTDEGVQGLYLVSTYFQKGDTPMNRLSTTIAGVVEIAHGRVVVVRCIDAKKAATELFRLQK